MDNMISNILRREINRQRAVLPFCLRVVAENRQAYMSSNAAVSETVTTRKETSDKLEDNPYYTKYAEKIERAKQAAAAVELKEQISKEQQQMKVELDRMEDKVASTVQKGHDPGPRGSAQASGTKPKSLDDVVHSSLLAGHTADEIKEIWSHYHASKEDCIFAVIPSSSYDKLYDNATQYPLFLYTLPRIVDKEDETSSAYEFFLGQYINHTFYFTSLVLYQRYKESAPPCLVINHYPELRHTKGIVLMNGEFDRNSINLLEAQCLANQVKLFFGCDDIRRKMLLHSFNKDPEHFDHNELIKVFEQSLIPPS